MSRKAIRWADLGALLGTAVGVVWAITDDFDTPDVTVVVLACLLYGLIWMSIGASTGLIAGMIEAKGITLRRLALGFLGAVALAACVGLLWIVIGWVVEAQFPCGIRENGPNLSVGGDVMSATPLAIAGAGIGFLAWAGMAMRQRRVAWGMVVAAAAGVCFLLSALKLPVREDFLLNLKQREEVVALARAGKLAADADSSVDRRYKILPPRYRQLSEGGTVWVEHAHGNMTVVFTRYVEGTCFSALCYEANDHSPDAGATSVKKLAPHWFFIAECA